jgi:hypothetical protein
LGVPSEFQEIYTAIYTTSIKTKNENDLNLQTLKKYFKEFTLDRKINTVYDAVSENKKMFKDVPSASVQAMMVALSNAIIYGFRGTDFEINDARLDLLTKCAIDSDATIGFNLPLIDGSNPKNGNFFVNVMGKFKSDDISSKEVEKAVKSVTAEEAESILKLWNSKKDEAEENGNEEENAENNEGGNENGGNQENGDENKDEKQVTPEEFAKEFGPKVMKDFRHNITNLFDMIVKRAESIKEKAKKEREEEAAKVQKSETEENQ